MAVFTSRVRRPGRSASRPPEHAAPPEPAAIPAPRVAAGPGPAVTRQRPAAVATDGQNGLLALLKVEAEAREAASVRDLQFLIANETRRLVRARQVFVLARSLADYEVTTISSLAVVDRTAPLVGWVETLARHALAAPDLGEAVALDPSAAGDATGVATSYPFRDLLLLPLRRRGGPPLGAVLLAREIAWTEPDLVVGKRLAAAYAHAWSALVPSVRSPVWSRLSSRRMWLAAVAVVGALALVPVPLSALAPAEVVARGAMIAAAPIDGVVESVDVKPNQAVEAGQVLVRLNDTMLRNRLEVAEREVTVADARLKQATQIAFSDPRGMHELGIARAELALKIAERNFARDMLAQSVVRAGRAGIAVFSDARELSGKPVATGERIMEIADPAAVELKVELPVADAITLRPGSRIAAFLDSDPLHPFAARLDRSDYKARPADNGAASFRVVGTFDGDGRPLPRLGVRGTAQISGDRVPLAFYLFRRPIAAFRQWTGL